MTWSVLLVYSTWWPTSLHGGRGTNLGVGAMRDMVNVTSAGVSMGSAVSTGGSMGNVLGSMGSVAGVDVSGVDNVVQEDSGNVRAREWCCS